MWIVLGSAQPISRDVNAAKGDRIRNLHCVISRGGSPELLPLIF
jgi:hypothetical protein